MLLTPNLIRSGAWDHIGKLSTFSRVSEIKVTAPSVTRIRTDRKLGWVVGKEAIVGKTTSGRRVKFEVFVTNLFEKESGRWLLVSHHAQRVPK